MREKILSAIGLLVFVTGLSTADSECLLIPLTLTFAGAVILLKVFH